MNAKSPSESIAVMSATTVVFENIEYTDVGVVVAFVVVVVVAAVALHSH
jgi:hypothetical protein